MKRITVDYVLTATAIATTLGLTRYVQAPGRSGAEVAELDAQRLVAAAEQAAVCVLLKLRQKDSLAEGDGTGADDRV